MVDLQAEDITGLLKQMFISKKLIQPNMPYSLYDVLEVLIHGYYEFWIGVTDGEQWCKFSLHSFFTFKLEGDLHIQFLRLLLCNEVDFLGAHLTNVNPVSSSDQLTVHDVFQYATDMPIPKSKDGMLKTGIC